MQWHPQGPFLQRALLMTSQNKASDISRGLVSKEVLSGRRSRTKCGQVCVDLGIEGAGQGLGDS